MRDAQIAGMGDQAEEVMVCLGICDAGSNIEVQR